MAHDDALFTGDHRETPTRHTKTRRSTRVNLLEEFSGEEIEEWEPQEAAELVLQTVGASLETRLTGIFEKATTAECRSKIAEHFGYFINAMGKERALPFADITFPNECPSPPAYDFDNPSPGRHLGMIQNKTYKPENGTYLDADNVTLCYAIMTHQNAPETIRLIESLDEPQQNTQFIVHVDAKEGSHETHAQLKHYFAKKKATNKRTNDRVHILDHPHRVRVNWGGFSMVNATLQMLRYAFDHQLEFDKFIQLASTNYPIASNLKIRQTIAQYPVDANLVHIVLKPSRPTQASWHYFVECDDAVHRIYRLPPLQNATAGAELYTSSQWFVLSRDFAHYLAYPLPKTFVYEFLPYAHHVVVSDETFFGTVLLHSPYCDQHHNWNYVHLQFDQWENQIPLEQRDPRKCIMPDPAHCGRSPTTITMDYVDLLTLSDDLWARKFLDHVDGKVKDVLDDHRREQELELRLRRHQQSTGDSGTAGSLYDQQAAVGHQYQRRVDTTFEGHGVLIVAKATVFDKMPLCMGLGESKNYVRLVPCFYDGVPENLAEGWQEGAVIVQETPWHNRWELGPCTQDGNLTRQQSADMEMTPGTYSPTGPRCMLTQMDGIRAGRCLDCHSNDIEPGGHVRVFPCVKRWPQFVSFGNGTFAPEGSMHINVPKHVVDRIRQSRPHDADGQEAHLCIGVLGRGDKDEAYLTSQTDEVTLADEASESNPMEEGSEADELAKDGRRKLKHWRGEKLVATRCSNMGAVIEWLFLPFIEEDVEALHGNETATDDKEPSEAVGAAAPTCQAAGECHDDESPKPEQATSGSAMSAAVA